MSLLAGLMTLSLGVLLAMYMFRGKKSEEQFRDFVVLALAVVVVHLHEIRVGVMS